MDVRQGSFISEAILKHEGVFPPLYGRLIEVGERTGNLEMVLRQLAIYLEKEEQLSRKIKGAVTYPAFVLVLAIGVVLLLMFVALPPLMDLFASFGAELPLPTRILMAITGFVTSNVIGLLGGIGGAIAVGVLFIRTEAGHWFLDRLMLRIPLISQITIQGAVARMARSMSSLLKAGIPIPEILRMVIRTQSNRVIKAGLQRVEQELLQGHGLSEPLATEPLFPRMLVQIVRVGEETGSLEGNMETLAAFYEDEVDRVVKALTDAIQPALTLFIGGVVGFVAISVIMPMYTLIGTIG
jgi:type IV pilus assembly protein PilC